MGRRAPLVSSALAGLLFALYLLESSRRVQSGLGPDLLPERWVLAGDSPRLWQLISYVGVHIDRTHAQGNCALIALAGAWIEPIIGGARVAALALLSTILVALVFVLTSDRDLCGASGTSAAFVATALCLALTTTSRPRALRAGVVALCVGYVGLFDVIPAIATRHPTHAVHAIGYATGVVLFALHSVFSRRAPSRTAPR